MGIVVMAVDFKEILSCLVIVRIDFVARICYVNTIAPSLGYSKQGMAA